VTKPFSNVEPMARVRALSLLVADAAERSDQTTPLVVSTARDGGHAVIRIAPLRGSPVSSTPAPSNGDEADASGDRSTADATFVLASRLIAAQGGEARTADDALEVRVGQE
jgi:hypothetical protein